MSLQSQSQRVVPWARPRQIPCTRCAPVDCAGGPLASVACLACEAYLCPACDVQAHVSKQQGHVRYPVAQLKSYIDFSQSKVGESPPRSHLGSLGQPQFILFDGARTPYETFHRAVRLYGEKDCFGVRSVTREGKVGPYVYQSYRQVAERVLNLAAALNSYGLDPKARVGLYSVNRPEWIIGEQACFANNFVTVPLYDTLGPDAASHVIGHAGLSAVICSADKVASLLTIAAKHSNLRYIIVMPQQAFELATTATSVAPATTASNLASTSVANSGGARVIPMLDAEKAGALLARDFKPTPPGPEDLATICFTSGTTDKAKGAMLTHRAFISDLTAVSAHGSGEIVKVGSEFYLSFLPLAHQFERLTLTNMMASGATIGFARGNPLLLMEDIEALRPTAFAGVPRLYNRIFDRINAMVNASSPAKRWLFHTAYNQKLANLRATGSVTHPVWDRLVFSKIAAKMGGRCRLMVTGSAPISDNVLQFLRICFSCDVIEGYGQTEGGAASTLSLPGDNRSFGNVGVPLITNLVKLVDVPDMGYTSRDTTGPSGAPTPRGEVCFKGPNLFEGYYADPTKTKEAIDADGWLHSGDIGMWLPDQSLKLIDRKKNLFKTSLGEYVSPEKCENVYQRSPYVAQAFVHGDGLESTLVAVIVPDEEELSNWAKTNRVAYRDFTHLLTQPAVKQLILTDMDRLARDAKLAGFEQVKAIHLCAQPFTVENELLTPTFKLKRNIAVKVFAKEIAHMYGKSADQAQAVAAKTQPHIKSKL